MWAASAGVPIKTILSGECCASDLDGGGWLAIGLALLDHFGETAAIEFAFDPAYAIDEELAIEMVDLVLEGDCQQFVCLDFDLLFFGCPRAHQNASGALHLSCKIDHRQTTLFPQYRTIRLDDAGVDELEQMFAEIVMVGVEHDQPPRIGDLRRGEANARRRVHRLYHAVEKAVHAAVDILNGFGRLLERGIGKFAYLEKRHLFASRDPSIYQSSTDPKSTPRIRRIIQRSQYDASTRPHRKRIAPGLPPQGHRRIECV